MRDGATARDCSSESFAAIGDTNAVSASISVVAVIFTIVFVATRTSACGSESFTSNARIAAVSTWMWPLASEASISSSNGGTVVAACASVREVASDSMLAVIAETSTGSLALLAASASASTALSAGNFVVSAWIVRGSAQRFSSPTVPFFALAIVASAFSAC